jgi:hypothetical protein
LIHQGYRQRRSPGWFPLAIVRRVLLLATVLLARHRQHAIGEACCWGATSSKQACLRVPAAASTSMVYVQCREQRQCRTPETGEPRAAFKDARVTRTRSVPVSIESLFHQQAQQLFLSEARDRNEVGRSRRQAGLGPRARTATGVAGKPPCRGDVRRGRADPCQPMPIHQPIRHPCPAARASCRSTWWLGTATGGRGGDPPVSPYPDAAVGGCHAGSRIRWHGSRARGWFLARWIAAEHDARGPGQPELRVRQRLAPPPARCRSRQERHLRRAAPEEGGRWDGKNRPRFHMRPCGRRGSGLP